MITEEHEKNIEMSVGTDEVESTITLSTEDDGAESSINMSVDDNEAESDIHMDVNGKETESNLIQSEDTNYKDSKPHKVDKFDDIEVENDATIGGTLRAHKIVVPLGDKPTKGGKDIYSSGAAYEYSASYLEVDNTLKEQGIVGLTIVNADGKALGRKVYVDSGASDIVLKAVKELRKISQGDAREISNAAITLLKKYVDKEIKNATLNITVPTKLSQLIDDVVSGKYLPLNSNAVSATKLKDSRLIWGQSFDGTKNIDGPLFIGDIKISYDEKNGALALTRVSSSDKKANLYATGGLTAFGTGSAQGGGSGTSYERLDRWSDYTTAKAAAVLSAFLGNDLNERLKQVEAGALTSVDWSIIKNKPTSMPASDVPAWAKAATKPSYSWNEIMQRPTKVSELTNDANYITATANVATATRLQTARTFWGQQFDGTGNVDGVLTVKHAGTAGIFLTSTSGESSFSCECAGSLRWVFGGYPTRFFLWNSAAKQVLSVLNNGNVVIGDTELNSPYKLNVKGSVRIGEKLCIAGTENGDITSIRNSNGAIKGITIANAAIRNALDFAWYATHYQIGNIRGGGTDSLGFGITKDNSMLIARFRESGSEFYSDLLIDGYLNLANNKGVCLKDKEGAAQRAMFISASNAVYFGCADRPLYTLFEGSELQFNVYNNGWQPALVISKDKSAQFYNNVLAMGGVTAYTTSDRRLKTNIKAVDSMKIIRSLGGTWQFDYKDTGRHSIGFIAQSVRGSMLKSMVYASDDGYLKLNYLDTRLIAIALGAAVQVDDKVERLKKRVRELEKEVEFLKHN